MHETSLIFTIAISLSLAFVFGFLAFKLRLSPIVGYLLAGVVIGPHTPGVVANTNLAAELSELGIILLMFGVGLHFSTRDLLSVSRVALLGAIPQVVLSTIGGAILAAAWGWTWGRSLVFGIALSVASTVVVISELEKRDLLADIQGKVAIGWLLVQDLVVVFILVLLPALAPALKEPIFQWGQFIQVLPAFFIAAIKALLFIAAMLFAGRRFFPWLLTKIEDTGSRELFTLFVIGVPVGIALLAAQLFGVSLALGAFLAGIVLNESDLSHQAAAKALPLQDAFAVLFFVSTGMSFNPDILHTHAALLISTVAFSVLFTPTIAFLLIVVVVRYSSRLASTISASLAQIGEFSLLLAALATKLGLFPDYVFSIIVGAVITSIAIHALSFIAIQLVALRAANLPLLSQIQANDKLSVLPSNSVNVENHAILVGYGRVGSTIGRALVAQQVPLVVIEQNREIANAVNKQGTSCIFGNAEIADTLIKARVENCRMIVITSPDPIAARLICDHAHGLNKNASIIVRTHSEEELHYLEQRPGVKLAVFGESELAKIIITFISASKECTIG